MRRPRTWLLVAVAALVALVGLGIALFPFAVHRLAVRQLQAATGRDVTITSLKLGLFRGRLALTGLRVAARADEPPLAELDRLDAEFGVWPLLKGRLELHSATVVAPRIRVIRRPSGELNVADLIERYMRGPKAKEPADVRIGRVRVENGLVSFEDRPIGQTWTASGLALDLKDIATRSDAATGTLHLAFKLGDTPVLVEARAIAGQPAKAHLVARTEGLDLALLAAYQPADAPVRFERGRFSTRLEVDYGATTGVRAGGEVTIADLVLTRRGQPGPFVITPLLAMTSRDVVYRDGQVTAARLEVTGEPSIVDASVSPPNQIDLKGVRVLVEDASYPTRGPARVALVAGLPNGGSADVRGTLTFQPVTTDLDVSVKDLDLALARSHVPASAPVGLGGGRLTAALKVGLAADGSLRAGGDVTVAEAVLLRKGQTEPLVTTPLLAVRAANVVYRQGTVTAGDVDVRGDPSIIDGTRTPPVRVDLKAVRVTAHNVRYPGSDRAEVSLAADLPNNGWLRVRGTAALSPLAADLDVRTRDIDLTLARPYLPPGTPVSLGGGRLTAGLKVRYAADTTVTVGGDLTVAEPVVLRAGQTAPLMTAPSLVARGAEVVYRKGAVRVRRIEVQGDPSVIDGTRTPPARVDLKGVRLTVEGARYPTGTRNRPARLALVAGLRTGGQVDVRGTVALGPTAADLDVVATDVDVAVARPWIPPDMPVKIGGGRLGATVKVRYAADGSVAVNGITTASDVTVLRAGESEPFLIHPRLEIALTELLVKDGAVSATRIVASGAPTLIDSGADPPRRFTTRSLRLDADSFTWPARGPTRLAVAAELPGSGTLNARGTFVTDTRALDAEIELKDAALEPYRPFLPFPAVVRGRVTGAFTVRGTFGEAVSVRARGDAQVVEFSLGPSRHPPLAIERLNTVGIDVQWPERVGIERILVEHPSVLIERDRDGSFVLRRLLTPGGGSRPAAAEGAASPPTQPPPAKQPGGPRVAVEIGELKVAAGEMRFVDRTTTPFYSEEITQLVLALRHFSTTPNGRAELSLQGVVGEGGAGEGGAFQLAGEVAPFGEPFYLDVSGELRDIAVPRANPYLQRFMDWIARSGRLTTKLHYRITGDELEATNEIVVHRLDVQRAQTGSEADKKIGVPLGLAVSILKDTHGDIRFTVPVGGRLSQPEFSFGDAIAHAIRNVLAKLVTAPFRAIGRIFRSSENEEVVDLKVNPVTFPAGTANLTADIARQLQRVADFMREAPYVKLMMRPVVTAADVTALKTQEATARIQRVQREQKIDAFDEAAVRTFRLETPKTPLPRTTDEVVAALRDRTPLPPDAPQRLAERRLETTRRELIRRAGIETERLLSDPKPMAPAAEGAGRVEFELEH